MKFKQVDSETISDILLGRSGLIIGPGATSNPNVYREVAEELFETKDNMVCGIRDIGRTCRTRGATEKKIIIDFPDAYTRQKSSAYLKTLVRPNWKAILSLSVDSYFEDRFQIENDKKPSRRPATVVTDLTAPFPPRSTPCFKLLGSLGTSSAAIFDEQYLLLRSQWRHSLSTFCDAIAGAPALCVGVDGDIDSFLDLVSEMLASPSTRPSSLVFLMDDPTTKNESFIRLTDKRIRVYTFSDSLSALVNRISSQEDTGRTKRMRFSCEHDDAMTKYRDVCVPVRNFESRSLPSVPKAAILDMLFSPITPEWLPYEAEMDFRRDAVVQVVNDVSQDFAFLPGHFCYAIIGSAANGKTTLLKRVALELAKKTSLFFG